MPINYGIMGLSVVSPIGMPGYYATGLSGLDLLPDDMTAARGPSAYRRFHLSYCNANRDDGGDGSSSPAERLDKCAEECAHLVVRSLLFLSLFLLQYFHGRGFFLGGRDGLFEGDSLPLSCRFFLPLLSPCAKML